MLAQKRHRLGDVKGHQIAVRPNIGGGDVGQMMSHEPWIRTDHSGEIAVIRPVVSPGVAWGS